jgi:hypothetical protein
VSPRLGLWGLVLALALLCVFVVGVLNGAYPLVSSIRRLARGQYNFLAKNFVNFFIKLCIKAKAEGPFLIFFKFTKQANKPHFVICPQELNFYHFKPIHHFFAKKCTKTHFEACAQTLILCLVSVGRFPPPSPCVMSEHICLKK